MSSPHSATTLFSSISDVERDTGIAKETLRVWERRYGFPQPQRDAHGERVYPLDQVQQLRHVKRLVDLGYRPGKIMHMTVDELTALAARYSPRDALGENDDPELAACVALLKSHQVHALRQRLQQRVLQLGLRRFVLELVAPLTHVVGDAWTAGALAVFEEHLFSEVVQSVMRNAIFAATGQGISDAARPRIVLTTVPQERHGLGLLMAEALFALEGAHCLSLGVQTPLADIAEAALSQRADVVALSFSSALSPRALVDSVQDLHKRLPAGVEIWVGGSCAALARRQLGADAVLDLDAIGAKIARWRAAHAQGGAAIAA